MAVRFPAIRPVGGSSSVAATALFALALAGASPAAGQAPAARGGQGVEPRSVLVHPTGSASVRLPANARIVSDRRADEPAPVAAEPGLPAEQVAPGTIVGDGMPAAGGHFDDYQQPSSGSIVDDGPQGPATHAWDDGAAGQPGGYEVGGPAACGDGACNGHCDVCRGYAGLDPAWQYNASCEPPGLFQRLYGLCRPEEGCWTGRAEALILSRNAPAFRPLYTSGAGGPVALNANQLESIAAVGPRLSLFKRDSCNTSWEAAYLYSGGFVAEKNYADQNAAFTLADPGIFGVTGGDVNLIQARLTSALQSAEINRRYNWGPATQFLMGFRWLQWQESLVVNDYYVGGQDSFSTNTYNNLFGGQIGLDTCLWQPARWLRFEGLLKAGGYYNSASQSSQYLSVAGPTAAGGAVNVGRSPATGSFVGELGLTAVMPLHKCIDFRVGYFGLWLTSIAQPAGQLSGQQLVVQPYYGSLTTGGNVVLQGLSLGLEGRW